jgi:hypothetical protein
MNENEIGTFGDFVDNSVPDLAVTHPVLKGLYERIADLEKQVETHKTIASEAQVRLRNQETAYRENEGVLQDILIEALGDEEIDQSVADKIAELYDLDLRKVFSLTIQVEVQVEVSAPVGTDPDDIANHIGFDSGYGGVSYSGVGDLESASWEISDWTEN